ncbi:MAG: EAL domain-containing protein [Candidatus Gastranaerophilaceae bacterium]
MSEFQDLNVYKNKARLLQKFTKILSATTVVLFVLAGGFLFYMLAASHISAEDYLVQTAEQTASNIRGRIKGDLRMLEVLSSNLSSVASFGSEPSVKNFLQQKVKDTKFYALSFSYPDGKTIKIESNGRLSSKNILSEDCFQSAMEGVSCFADRTSSPAAKSGFVNKYYVPVYDGSKVVGVLGAAVDTDIFSKILAYNDFDGSAANDIISSNGDYVLKDSVFTSSANNIFKENIKFVSESPESVLKKFQTEGKGTFWYRHADGSRYLAAFSPIGYNNFLALTSVSHGVITMNVDTISLVVFGIVGLICVILILFLFYVQKTGNETEKAVLDYIFRDKITDGTNQTKFFLDSTEILTSSKYAKYALISVNLTKFKIINELYGHEKADKILKNVYDIICVNLTPGGLVTRIGSNFVVLMTYDKPEFLIKYFVKKVEETLINFNTQIMPHLNEENGIKVVSKLNVTFGIYLVSDKTVSVRQMYDRAVFALKNIVPGSTYEFYNENIRTKILAEKALEEEMVPALQNGQFKMFLQPEYDIKTGAHLGAEALVRWNHPTRGIMLPDAFLPTFEKNGFILNIDEYMCEQVFKFLYDRKQNNLPLFPISVNISKIGRNNEIFAETVIATAQRYGIETKYVVFELSDISDADDMKNFEEVVHKLQAYGFAVAFDNFGVGSFSFDVLKNSSVNVIKLDRSFIAGELGDAKGRTVVLSVLNLASRLNVPTVATGIETVNQAKFLSAAGCGIAQGFLYGRPVPAEEYSKVFLQNG